MQETLEVEIKKEVEQLNESERDVVTGLRWGLFCFFISSFLKIQKTKNCVCNVSKEQIRQTTRCIASPLLI